MSEKKNPTKKRNEFELTRLNLGVDEKSQQHTGQLHGSARTLQDAPKGYFLTRANFPLEFQQGNGRWKCGAADERDGLALCNVWQQETHFNVAHRVGGTEGVRGGGAVWKAGFEVVWFGSHRRLNNPEAELCLEIIIFFYYK